MNLVLLIGNIDADPAMRYTRHGRAIAKLTVVTRGTSPDDASGKRRIELHKVVVFDEGLAKFAQQHLRKGAYVCVEGPAETHEWKDKDGHTHETTEVVVRRHGGRLFVIDDEIGSYEQPGEDRGDGEPSQVEDGYGRFAEMDEEIPF